MKPSFALDFRDGVIALLHRTTRGWQQVGSTPADAPDLTEALSYLRATALGLSPRGLATKLVIPNEQVLYTQVHAPGPDVAKRRRQIKAGLEGLTPYSVDDLVYDWWGSGPEIHVAVVARETLTEAEAFAAEHRFNPVSFVAAPEDGGYKSEPFFGPSALAATLLAEGEKVERDLDPIAVVTREYPRASAAPGTAEPKVAPPPVEAPMVEMPMVEMPAVRIGVPAVDEAAPSPVEAAVAPVPSVPEAGPLSAAAHAGPDAAALAVEPRSEDADTLPDFSAARAPAAGVTAFDPVTMAADLVDEAPMALDVTDEPEGPSVPGGPGQGDAMSSVATTEIPVKDDLPASPAPSIMAAFSSRRATDHDGPADGAAPAEKMGPAEMAIMTADFAAAVEAKARKSPAVGPAPSQRASVPRPALARPASALPLASRDAVPFPGRSQAAKLAPARAKVAVSAPGIAGPRRERNVVPLTKPAELQPGVQTGAQIAAQIGAKSAAKGPTGLDGRPLAVRGKPRYLGLILTGLLLLALTLVAAWSSYYLSFNEADPDAVPAENAVASAASGPAPDGATDALPSAEDEALADGQGPDPAPESAPASAASLAEQPSPTEPAPSEPAPSEPAPIEPAPSEQVATAAVEPATEPAPEPAAPLPEPAPATGVVTEAALAAVPANDPQDEIFLAAADTPPQTSDPVVMPKMAVGSDPPPDLAAPPPPFGTVYTFDAAGRIQPTPEGIMTPEGVLLIAGAPKMVPPLRPAALTAAAAAPVAALPVAVVPEVAGAVGSDPALAGKKPKPRPAGVVDSAATAERQGEVLAPAPDSRFASARPQRRPTALTRTASADAALANEPAANEAASASLAANGVQASTSALAVAVSRKPAARPSGMDQAVDAAVAAAVQAADPEPVVQTASLAPEEQSEPEAEAAAPRLPTNASVAKQATTKDALNLSKVALLGIFGTASGRYAMVRQPGGGVKKVGVGDTIDGGRIAAISATAVQYQKGGRMLTLTLPRG